VIFFFFFLFFLGDVRLSSLRLGFFTLGFRLHRAGFHYVRFGQGSNKLCQERLPLQRIITIVPP